MRIKKKKMFIMGIALLLISAGIFCFPHITQELYDLEAEKVIDDFHEKMNDTDENTPSVDHDGNGINDNLDELYNHIKEYNQQLFESGQKDLVDPFSYQQVAFSLTQWGFDEEMIGSIKIPKMGIELPIYLGATEENMAKGAVHLSQTSLPIGGMNTNAVIAAHRGYSYAAMFRDIEALNIGDEVTIINFHDTLLYRVKEIKILDPTDIDQILIQPGRDLVTLITCHPYRHNYQRYAVYCERDSGGE